MFVKVSPPPVGDNKGSCQKLANYLSKEDGSFFDGNSRDVSYEKVVNKIDKNASHGLRKVDDKFYMIAINPSHEELEHIIGRKVKDTSELTLKDRSKIEDALKEYTHDVMDVYAKNFGRTEKVKGKEDILYFGRIESYRTYNFNDTEVEQGLKKTGDLKDGLNYHVHVIVSRKSADGYTKLSPLSKSAGNEWIKDDKLLKRGFSHENFKLLSQEKFSERFKFISENNYKIPQVDKESILGKIQNEDLKDILKNNFFQDPYQVNYLMQKRGYSKSYEYGKNIYSKNGERTAISYKDIKAFCTDIPEANVSKITDEFNLYKFNKDPNSYQQKNIEVEERIAHNKETQKDYKYYILHDTETKTSVNLSTIKNYANENNISLINRKYLDSIDNKDLRECLDYNVKSVYEVKLLMSERGYDMKFDKGNILFERNILPYQPEKTELSYKELTSFIEFNKAEREDAIKDFSTLTNVNELKSEKLSSLSYRIIEDKPKENDFKEDLIKNLQQPENLILKNKINTDYQPAKMVVDEISKDIFSVKRYKENLNVTNFSKESVLKEVTNNDLKDILTNHSFENHMQVSFLMEQKGYHSEIEFGKYSFTKEGEQFEIAIKKIQPFARKELDKENLTHIAKGFKAYEFDLNPDAYKQEGIQIQKKIYTDNTGENRTQYVLHDNHTKTSLNVSTLKGFARNNDINIHDFRIDNILSKIGNEDLKRVLVEHNISSPNDVSFLMKEKGYDVTIEYGKYSFEKNGQKAELSGSLIKEFYQEPSFDNLSDISKRFNLYKFEQNPAAYNQDGIQIERRVYNRQYSDGWKEESYFVIHDSQTKTSINVSDIKNFARQNDIALVSRADIEQVPNLDLKASLNYNIKNVYDLKLLMSDKGYQIRDEGVNVVFSRMGGETTISREVLGGMIEFNKAERERSVSKLCSEKDAFNLTKQTLQGTAYNLTDNSILNKQAQFERNTAFQNFLCKKDNNSYVLSSTKADTNTLKVLVNGVNPLKDKDYIIDTKSGNITEKEQVQRHQEHRNRAGKTDRSLTDFVKNNVSNRVKGAVKNEVLQETLVTERRIINKVSKVGKKITTTIELVTNPSATLSKLTVKAAKDILTGIIDKGSEKSL